MHSSVSVNKLYLLISDTASANVITTDVFLKISRKKVHLLFEMLPGFKANKFVDEISKASEGEFFCCLHFGLYFHFKIACYSAANKKRAPPSFSWLEVYHPSEAEPASGPEPTSVASTPNEIEPASNVHCHDAIPSHLNQKADSALSSPDITVHRSSIATGTLNEMLASILLESIELGF